VEDSGRAKALWPVLGRPGAVLVDGEIVGTWRPRKSGAKFTVAVELWTAETAKRRRDVADQAEQLAAFRQVQLTGVDFST
jgi:hypothetical protein